MTDFFAMLVRFTVRLLVLAAGVVLFVSLFFAVMLLATLWLLGAGWARLTGKPVTPWAMRMDPLKGFSSVYRSGDRWAGRAAAGASAGGSAAASDAGYSRRGGVLPGAAADVMDVEVRDVR